MSKLTLHGLITPYAMSVCRMAVGSKLGVLSERIETEPVGEFQRGLAPKQHTAKLTITEY